MHGPMAILLSLIAVAYNNLINRWPPFHGAAYVPVNLVFAGTLTVAAAIGLGLSKADLGLGGDIGDLLLPSGLVALFGVVTFAAATSRHAHRIADKRVGGMHGRTLAFYVLVRIPLGTAVTEELLFRGVLFAAWRDAGASPFVAALCASLAFGLWHISPTVIGLRINDPEASDAKVRAAVAGAVLFTTVAGLVLTWLRIQSGSLLSPIVVHAGINSLGAVAAVVAARQRSSS